MSEKDLPELPSPWIVTESTDSLSFGGTLANYNVAQSVKVLDDLSTSVQVFGMSAPHLDSKVGTIPTRILPDSLRFLTCLSWCHRPDSLRRCPQQQTSLLKHTFCMQPIPSPILAPCAQLALCQKIACSVKGSCMC